MAEPTGPWLIYLPPGQPHGRGALVCERSHRNYLPTESVIQATLFASREEAVEAATFCRDLAHQGRRYGAPVVLGPADSREDIDRG